MKILVAVRGWLTFDDGMTLDSDLGPRFKRAIEAYGWEAHYHRLQHRSSADYEGVIQACAQIRPDILLWDDDYILNPAELNGRRFLMAIIRSMGIKIVPIYFDGWAIREEVIRAASQHVDAIWALVPSFGFWDTLGVPIMHCPIPHGVVLEPDDTKPITVSFCGRIAPWHAGRAEFMALGLPIEWSVSDYKNEDKDPLQAYANYMARLSRTGAALSLCMRWKQNKRVVTDRVFEAPLAGALLVQEYAPCVKHFMTAGKHYLEFTTPADLRDALSFIGAKPDEAKAIRRAGHEHITASYSDHGIMKQFEGLLIEVARRTSASANAVAAHP